MIQLVGRDIAIEIEEEDDAPPSDRNADKEESGVEEEVAGGSGPGHVRNLPQEDGSSSSPTPWLLGIFRPFLHKTVKQKFLRINH